MAMRLPLAHFAANDLDIDEIVSGDTLIDCIKIDAQLHRVATLESLDYRHLAIRLERTERSSRIAAP